MHKNASYTVGVLGASGYTGRELLRVLKRHGGVRVETATSESEPVVHGVATVPLAQVREKALPEVLFSCLPHGVSASEVQWALDAGVRVVDLSADFRLSCDAVYGLTEIARHRLPDAKLVANPGCYPTVSLLGVLPLARAGAIDTRRPIVINAASGVTGAGRSPKRALMYAEVADDYRAYGVGNDHRHLPEIVQGLAPYVPDADVIFAPHLLPVKRGILATIHVPVTQAVAGESLEELFTSMYADEPFVHVMLDGAPALSDVVYRNVVAMYATPTKHVRQPTVTVVAAIDNLVKGAAGQAVQNMNVMLGYDETDGLLG